MVETSSRPRMELAKFFALAVGITWLFWIPDALAKRGVLPDVVWTNLGFFGAWGPLIAALYLVARQKGWSGIKSLLKRGTDYGFGKGWWLVALALFPAVISIAYVVSISTEGAVPRSEAAIVLTSSRSWLVGGGTG